MAKITMTGRKSPIAAEQTLGMAFSHGSRQVRLYLFGEDTPAGRKRFVHVTLTSDEIARIAEFDAQMRAKLGA